MHHGTLLVNINMDVMSRVLTPSSLKLQSKGVASVAARVVNLGELNSHIDHGALTSALIHSFQQNFFCSSSAITCMDQSAMMALSEVAAEAQKMQVAQKSSLCLYLFVDFYEFYDFALGSRVDVRTDTKVHSGAQKTL